MERVRLLFDHLVWIKHQFLSSIRDSRKAGCLWLMIRGVGGVRKSIDQSWLAKELGLGLLCWGFKGVQEEIPSDEASTLQIGSVAFPPGQGTCQQLHPCHRLFDQDRHQDNSHPPYSSDVATCDFWLFPQLRGYFYETIESGCDDCLWHAHKRGLPWGLIEVFGTVQQVYCTQRSLLRSGLEFHVCTINKSSHTKKVWKLIVCTSYNEIKDSKIEMVMSVSKDNHISVKVKSVISHCKWLNIQIKKCDIWKLPPCHYLLESSYDQERDR